jgi:hypothetical protein
MAGTTRVIILAAGDGTRWDNYRDTPKHLVTIEKEILLHRTVKQFLKHTDDVCIVGLDERYNVEGATLYIPKVVNTNYKDGNKFMSSQTLWNKHGRTVLVFGDVYFTNDAVKMIMSTPGEFKWFLRKGASEISGARWKEIFAFAFDPTMINNITQTLLLLISRDQVQKQAGWSLYKSMIGTAYGDIFANHHHVNIDDWTEDFDFPEDLEIWEEHRKLAKQAKTKAKK